MPDTLARLIRPGSRPGLRGLMEVGSCLAHPQEVMARPGFLHLALSYAGEPSPTSPARTATR